MTHDHSRILIVTPTLGESAHLDQTVRQVASLTNSIAHVLSAPAGQVHLLQERFPMTQVVADYGKSGGLYGALNAALDAVPLGWGWFTYINDDDFLLPGFGEMARRHMRSPNPEGVAYGDVEVIREDGRVISRVTTERNPVWIPALLHEGISPLMQQGMLIQRETMAQIGRFDTRYRLCADLDLWLRAYAGGHRFRHYSLPVARFRLRSGQLSSNTELTIREQDEIVGRLLPTKTTPALGLLARLRYRLCNLPRYAERLRTSGFRSSYQILASAGAPRK
jgi:hypothetical protein